MNLLKPTYDELFALVQRQSKIIFEQGQTIKRLEKKITELEEKLKLNSKNSSKPPSTDQKGKTDVPKKKGGAKPGHPGHFRPLFSTDQVDTFVNLRAEHCPSCGETVQPSGEPPSIHQQVEIAPKPYIVTQYNRESFYCPCCRRYGVASLPSHVGPSAFGTRLSAFMGFLTGTCRLSRRIALSVMQEGLDLRAAVGTQTNIENRIATARGKHSLSLKRFARSLLRKAQNLWIFATRDSVEPTNNQAERDLRGIVITRRISYGSKSERGDRFIERINSVVTTLKRQGKKCLDYLTEALGAWKTGSSAPTIFSQSCYTP